MGSPRRPVYLLFPPLLAFLLGGLFWSLESFSAYRPPWSVEETRWTPRMDALRDLREWAARKAEEERKRAELLKSLTTERMVELGREIVHGRGLCLNCHSIGSVGGSQGPSLDGVGQRSRHRVQGLSDIEYLAQSLYEPQAFVVPGYPPVMTPAHQPPIGLDDLEIRMVIAYLQSLGGTPTIAPETKLAAGLPAP